MDLIALDSQLRRSRLFAVWMIAAVALFYSSWFFVHGGRISDRPDDWGTFGDFFGGVVNPLIAFMAFYWLTVSVRLQKEELAETRAELAKSSAAQALAARYTYDAAKLHALNGELAALSEEIVSVREDVRMLVGQLNRPIHGDGYARLDGVLVSITDIHDEISFRIHDLKELRTARSNLLSKIRSVMASDDGVESSPADVDARWYSC